MKKKIIWQKKLFYKLFERDYQISSTVFIPFTLFIKLITTLFFYFIVYFFVVYSSLVFVVDNYNNFHSKNVLRNST